MRKTRARKGARDHAPLDVALGPGPLAAEHDAAAGDASAVVGVERAPGVALLGDADAARRAQTKKQGGKSLIVGKLLQFTYELRMTGDLEIEKYDKSIGAISCDNASRAPKKEGAENNNFKHLPLLNYALECTVHPCKLRPAASNDPDAQDQHVDQ